MGDFYITHRLARRILALYGPRAPDGQDHPPDARTPVDLLAETASVLGIDFLAALPGGAPGIGWEGPRFPEEIRFLDVSGFFVFCFVEGGFTRLCREWGLGETLAFSTNRPGEAREMFKAVVSEAFRAADQALSLGCRGVMLGEDFAFERGLFLHPFLAREVLYPAFELVLNHFQAPVVLHCDGDASDVLPDIGSLGFRGFHSCEPTGKMTVKRAAEMTGGKICLIGGMAQDALRKDAAAAALHARDLLHQRGRAPYVFGSSAGVLDDSLAPEAVVGAYRAISSHLMNGPACP